MIKKIAFGAALAAQVISGSAFARDVRPAAVSLQAASVQPVMAVGAVRASSKMAKKDHVFAPFLLPLLGLVAVIGVVAVVASGGDDDSSPN